MSYSIVYSTISHSLFYQQAINYQALICTLIQVESIRQHLLENAQCAANYNEDQFSILDTARNGFHLSVLEASYMRERRPILCKQKEFVYTLNLFK